MKGVDRATASSSKGKGNVESDAGISAQQQDSIDLGKRRRGVDARLKRSRQDRDEITFVPEPRDQREIDIDRFTRLSPAQHGESADEAEPLLLRLAHSLQFCGRADQRVHGRRSLANRRCCSMSPELGFGAREPS